MASNGTRSNLKSKMRPLNNRRHDDYVVVIVIPTCFHVKDESKHIPIIPPPQSTVYSGMLE